MRRYVPVPRHGAHLVSTWISFGSRKQQIFVTAMRQVFLEVGKELLDIIWMNLDL
jgi:hypothetical protein